MKRLTNIVLFAVAMLLGSCDRESLNDQPPTGEGEVQIKLALAGVDAHSTRATEGGTSEEDAVNTVQLVIFNNATGAFFKEYKLSPAAPKPIVGVVWDSSTQTVTLKDILTIGTAYDIYVVANATIANASTLTSAAFEAQILANTTLPLPAPTTASGLVMTGKAKGHTFANLGTVLNIDLTRMAAKIQIKVVFDPAIATKLPNITFLENEPLRILNVPNKSYFFNPQTKAFPTSDLTDMQREFVLKEGVPTVFYLPENAIKGNTAEARESATQFILNLPFSYIDKDNNPQENHNNYYLLNINNSSVDPYEIVRNTSYNVTVTVNSLGDKIPTISGTTIKTVVKPWTIHEMSGEEGSRENIELSNTECRIYGDHANNILVATVKMKTEGMVASASFSTEGTGFTLASPTAAQISYDTPTDIRIKTTENIWGGKVHVTVGRETKTITISREFDHKAYHGHVGVWGNLFISDSEWCTLATTANDDTKDGQKAIINSRDSIYVYINAPKTTLGDQVRMANIMATEYKTTDVVRRIVVVQQPYVTTPENEVKWATGNISLGRRPDGTLCYVIGAADENSLLFMFNQKDGFNSGGQSWPWDSSEGKGGGKIAYNPTGMGSNASAMLISEGSYGATYEKNDYLGDPCKYVYSSDSKIQWRSPTSDELSELVKLHFKWIAGSRDVPCAHRGSMALNDQIFLPATGLIAGGGDDGPINGNYNYAPGNQDQRVLLWSSVPDGGGYGAHSLNVGANNIYDDNNQGATGSIRRSLRKSALGVRCVRSK